MFKLIDKAGQEVTEGQEVKCVRGKGHQLIEFYPPKNPAYAGSVVVKTYSGFTHEYSPSVFGLKIVGQWEDE